MHMCQWRTGISSDGSAFAVDADGGAKLVHEPVLSKPCGFDFLDFCNSTLMADLLDAMLPENVIEYTPISSTTVP